MLPVWLTDTVTSDLERALHYTLLWGLEGVELRTVGGTEERVPRVNETHIKRRLEKAEMLPAAIDPAMFEGPVRNRAAWLNELIRFDEALRFCERIGCPRIVVPPFAHEPENDRDTVVEVLRRAGEAAAEYGRTIAVLNHTEATCSTGRALADLLAAVDHAFVMAAWSPAEALRAGEDPAEGLAALGERVTLVRCRDGQRGASGWQELPFGEGTIEWGEHLQLLWDLGFRGPLSLEVNVDPRPKVGLREATRLIRMIRDVQQSA